MGGAGLGLARKLMASISADHPNPAAGARTPEAAERQPVQGKLLPTKGTADGRVDPVQV